MLFRSVDKCSRITHSLIEDIKNQPCAYDKDEVICQLSNMIFSAELYGDEWDGQTVRNLLCLGDVIEIVEKGGV